MDKRQEAKLNMYHAVISHCNANNAIIAAIPAFITIFDAFKIKVDSLVATAQKEIQVIKGITNDKNAKREALYLQAANIANIVYAYAANQKNFVLKENVNFSKSKLKDKRDEELAPVCYNILNAASTNLIALAAYGITAASLTNFTDTINNYKAVISATRNATVLRKTYSASLRTLFKDCSNILYDQLDTLSVQFKTTNNYFYTAYKNNRIIIDPASHKNPAPTLP